MSIIADLVLKLANAKCPKCSYALNMSDIERAQAQLNAGVLVCPKCQHLIRSGLGGGHLHGSSSPDKSSFQQPEQIKFAHLENGSLQFSVPWKMQAAVGLLFFGLFWVGLIGFMGLMAAKSGGARINKVYTTDLVRIYTSLIGVAMPGLLVLTGWLVQFANKRQITVSRNLISFSDGPLWFGKVQQVNPSLITNLSIRSKSGGSVNRKRFYHFDIFMHLKDGGLVKLCTARTIADAIFIEQKIESYFNIKDNKALDLVRVV